MKQMYLGSERVSFQCRVAAIVGSRQVIFVPHLLIKSNLLLIAPSINNNKHQQQQQRTIQHVCSYANHKHNQTTSVTLTSTKPPIHMYTYLHTRKHSRTY